MSNKLAVYPISMIREEIESRESSIELLYTEKDFECLKETVAAQTTFMALALLSLGVDHKPNDVQDFVELVSDKNTFKVVFKNGKVVRGSKLGDLH